MYIRCHTVAGYCAITCASCVCEVDWLKVGVVNSKQPKHTNEQLESSTTMNISWPNVWQSVIATSEERMLRVELLYVACDALKNPCNVQLFGVFAMQRQYSKAHIESGEQKAAKERESERAAETDQYTHTLTEWCAQYIRTECVFIYLLVAFVCVGW